MKKLLCMLLLNTLLSYSQAFVGKMDYYREKTTANKSEDMNKIIGKKILFVLPDIFSNEDYNKILSQSWTFSPYEIISYKEFNKNITKYKTEGKVIAEFVTYKQITTYASGQNRQIKQTEHIFNYITFYSIDKITLNKKKETVYDRSFFAWINFTPDYSLARTAKVNDLLDIHPEQLANFKLGYLKNYLKTVSDNFSSNTLVDGFKEFENKNELMKLKSQKLYIPEDVKRKNIAVFSRADRDINSLTEDYKFDKEIITVEELNKKILSGEDFYYFYYNQNNSKKMISVLNSKTGEEVYNSFERMAYNIQEKDFKQLNKAVSKSSK